STSQSRPPCSISTYSSQPSSPTYEMRDTSTFSVSTSIHRQVAKGNPSFETSSPVAAPSTSRAFGPHSPSVHHAEVWSSSWAEPSSGRCETNHFRSAIPENPPIAHGQVFGVDDRRPPARLPRRLAGHHPVAVLVEQPLVGSVPERALPSGGLVEHGAEVAFARVERRESHVPIGLPLLHGVD